MLAYLLEHKNPRGKIETNSKSFGNIWSGNTEKKNRSKDCILFHFHLLWVFFSVRFIFSPSCLSYAWIKNRIIANSNFCLYLSQFSYFFRWLENLFSKFFIARKGNLKRTKCLLVKSCCGLFLWKRSRDLSWFGTGWTAHW